MKDKINVGVLGATGMVGQNYISLLADHPWFRVNHVAASSRSAGKTYGEAVRGRWHLTGDVPGSLRDITVSTIDEIELAREKCTFVFSALGSHVAREYEERYAVAGIPVVSNASAHRSTPDVPMVIPEINYHHLDIIPIQQRTRGWVRGFIVVKPNCSLQSYMTPLYALHEKFGLKQAVITTMQAVSGAGHPGVSSLDIMDNVIPFIQGEEEKSENEPLKILGSIDGSVISNNEKVKISAHCNRVPVIHGHTACVSVEFERKPTRDEILGTWKDFRGISPKYDLPSSPRRAIIYREEPDRPQPRLDRDAGNGMTVVVGRLRDCNVLHYRFVGLSHNTVRGAAGGGILNGELLVAMGYL
ncbi:MAG: aspartate-semialdehyde dehydrogenase [Candidatus Thermoplasmatota archaeon]|nr:aspartate-semialdehyde dehydrogenase [Candidatus Thermoplasmatota archaeon]MDP7265922.1 aspartate-semialdehyde dehydrogenase [Candidatus Thermoplasmatota archaeon]